MKLNQPRQFAALTAICAALLVTPVLVGCDEEGPAEKAGKAVDQAVEQAGDKVEDAADKLQQKTD